MRVNENCETNLPRLYAIGEAASGMDGAERIDGGPAITWCLTMGYITGKEAAKTAKQVDWPKIDSEQVYGEIEKINSLYGKKEGIKGFEVQAKIKDLMWNYVGPVRDGKGLKEALNQIEMIKSDDLPRLYAPDPSKIFNKGLTEALEARHMTELAEMITRAALMREESRKSHYRMDFLKQDNEKWLKNIVIKEENGKMIFTTVPAVITRMKPSEAEAITE